MTLFFPPDFFFGEVGLGERERESGRSSFLLSDKVVGLGEEFSFSLISMLRMYSEREGFTRLSKRDSKLMPLMLAPSDSSVSSWCRLSTFGVALTAAHKSSFRDSSPFDDARASRWHYRTFTGRPRNDVAW